MPSNRLRDILRGHIVQGHIRRFGDTWEGAIYTPWQAIDDKEWLAELDRMLDNGEICRVEDTYEIELVSDEPRNEVISVSCTAREMAIIRMAAIVSGVSVETFALSAALGRAVEQTRRDLGLSGKEV